MALSLEVVTRTGLAVQEDVDEVQAPSVAGEFGVLPGHVPLLSALRAGVLTYRAGSEVHQLAIGPGFAEVLPERVLVLVDRCSTGDGLDRAAAAAQLQEAEDALAELEAEGVSRGVRYDEVHGRLDFARAVAAIVDPRGPTTH